MPLGTGGDEIRGAIRSLHGLPYGWDGSDALPVRPDAYLTCLEMFADNLRLEDVDADVRLAGDGTIWIELTQGERTLIVEVVAQDIVQFTRFLADDTTVEGVIRLNQEDGRCERASLFRWIEGGLP
jgi:hypothetical protein